MIPISCKAIHRYSLYSTDGNYLKHKPEQRFSERNWNVVPPEYYMNLRLRVNQAFRKVQETWI